MVRLGLIADDEMSDDELEEEYAKRVGRFVAPTGDDLDLDDEPSKVVYSPGGLFTSDDMAIDRTGRGLASGHRETMGLTAQLGLDSPSARTRLALSPAAESKKKTPRSRTGTPPRPPSSRTTPTSRRSTDLRKRASLSSLRRSSEKKAAFLDVREDGEVATLLKSAHSAISGGPAATRLTSSYRRDFGLWRGRSFGAAISPRGVVAFGRGGKIVLRTVRCDADPVDVASTALCPPRVLVRPVPGYFPYRPATRDPVALRDCVDAYAEKARDPRTKRAWHLVRALWFSAVDDLVLAQDDLPPPPQSDAVEVSFFGGGTPMTNRVAPRRWTRREACARDRRYARVSEWLAARCSSSSSKATTTTQKKKKKPTKKIEVYNLVFELLCSRDTKGAAEVALDAGETRLALAIAAGNSSARESLGREFERRRALAVDAETAFVARAVGVAAGRLDLEDDIGKLAAPEDLLPWPTRLGLHVWYERQPGEPLSAPIRRYDVALAAKTARRPGSSTVLDAEYRLLQYACARGLEFGDDYPCDLDRVYAGGVLDPRAVGRGPADASFTWHVHLVLDAANKKRSRPLIARDDDDAPEENDDDDDDMGGIAARLGDALVFQLVGEKRISDALFVVAASHSVASTRTRLARQLLDRFPETESQLAPPEWTDAAKALQLGLDGPWPAYASTLVRAGDYDGAHRALLRVAAPARAVFAAADAQVLEPLLEALARDAFETHGPLNLIWKHGAGLYLDFLRFRTALKSLDDTATVDRLRQLQLDARALRTRWIQCHHATTTLGATAKGGVLPSHLVHACKQNIVTSLATTELSLAKSLLDDPGVSSMSPLAVIDDLSRSTSLAPSARRDLLDDIAYDLVHCAS